MGAEPDPAVGRSAVVVAVPEVEAVVGAARAAFDPVAAVGVPAHVTVVYPFLPLADISAGVLDELRVIVASEPAPAVTFVHFGRFPGVLWLDPSPAEPFVRLTRALVARWPEALPYGGAFGDDVTPHLTVTSAASDSEMAAVERSLMPSLPVTSVLAEAVLLGFDGARWTTRCRFPFGR